MEEIGGVDVWLHVMAADDVAKGLYSGCGYTVVEPPTPSATRSLGNMFTKAADQKLLMRSVLKPDGANAMPFWSVAKGQ